MSTNRLLREFFPDENYTQIQILFPEKMRDLRAIATFLLDNEKMKEQLAKLELILELAAQADNRFDSETRRFNGFVRGQPFKHNKLLSRNLEKWATENGFQPYKRLNDRIENCEFNAVLSDAHLFKDPFFRGKMHGEWTHFIQWFCIVEYYKQNPFLSCDPVELYRWIGNTQNVYKLQNLWYRVFEFNNLNFSNLDADWINLENMGARVYYFHLYLVSEEADSKFPVLSQLIQGRENKGPVPEQPESPEQSRQGVKRKCENVTPQTTGVLLDSNDHKEKVAVHPLKL